LEEADFNKRVFLTIGLGTIELLNINGSVRVNANLYGNLAVGVTHAQGSGDNPIGGTFLKIGASYRFLSSNFTPVLSMDGGIGILSIENTDPPTNSGSDRTYLVSFLGGFEQRHPAGFVYYFLIGERFNTAVYGDNKFLFGFQAGVGWSF
jgi:hypothetical protein